jgi:hypothetical protein
MVCSVASATSASNNTGPGQSKADNKKRLYAVLCYTKNPITYQGFSGEPGITMISASIKTGFSRFCQ